MQQGDFGPVVSLKDALLFQLLHFSLPPVYDKISYEHISVCFFFRFYKEEMISFSLLILINSLTDCSIDGLIDLFLLPLSTVYVYL